MNWTMKRGAIVAGAAIVVAATAGFTYAAASDSSSEQSSEAAYTAAHRGEAAVPESAAVEAALSRHAGTPTDVHLQNEGDGLRWEVKPQSGTQVWEVQVDGQSGQVVSDQPDE
ncbi:MAG: Peptidase propeptide and domain [Frankiaceae bacterium]|jgi:uncharacterized membrane protein YkoI|nr:Peptidase propeptide and domain [Frankiaceae bacterium]MDQ1672163.1 Peptidase propeptide and domain [Frankiaceae bacterium]